MVENNILYSVIGLVSFLLIIIIFAVSLKKKKNEKITLVR